MKLRTLGRALLRRWYAALAGLLAVAGLAYVLYGAVPVDYKASGSVVLLPPSKSVGAGGNPYLFLNGLGQAMDVLTRRLTAPDVSERLMRDFPEATYTAAPDVTSGSSILVVAVKSRDSGVSARALRAVLDSVPAELAAMQVALAVPSEARIGSMPVADPAPPIADGKPRLQAVAAASMVGAVGVLMLTALLDGLLLRRAARRSEASDVIAEESAERSPRLVSLTAASPGSGVDRDSEEYLNARLPVPTRHESRAVSP